MARIQRRTVPKGLIDMGSHNYVVTHLKSNILECEVKCSLGSITTNKGSGGNGIPPELFINFKNDVVKSAALNIPANLENSALVTGLEKVSFHCNPREQQCQRIFKLLQNCTHFTCLQGNAQNPPS